MHIYIIYIIYIYIYIYMHMCMCVYIYIYMYTEAYCGQSPYLYWDSGLQRVRRRQNLACKGWKSHVHRDSPGDFESTNLSRDTCIYYTYNIIYIYICIVCRETGRRFSSGADHPPARRSYRRPRERRARSPLRLPRQLYMYVYMYVCMYVCMYIYTYVYTYNTLTWN